MKILVIGPQHSCTRLIVAILDRHIETSEIGHYSIPGNKPPVFNFPGDNLINSFDKIVIVNRDSNAIDKSNIKQGFGIDYENDLNNISQKSKKIINDGLKNINMNKVVFISIENLVDYKENYLRQFFKLIGLNDNNYDYNLSGKYEFDPPRWFTVNLDLIDPNRKYLK